MNDFFKKIFNTAPKTIPESVQKFLTTKFPEAFNIEWEFKDGLFESVFYLDGVEYIAKISESKGIVEYKINLNPTELPEQLRSSEDIHGEIMNVIAIHHNGDVMYEIIVRDKKLNRTLLLLNSSGELLNWKKI